MWHFFPPWNLKQKTVVIYRKVQPKQQHEQQQQKETCNVFGSSRPRLKQVLPAFGECEGML